MFVVYPKIFRNNLPHNLSHAINQEGPLTVVGPFLIRKGGWQVMISFNQGLRGFGTLSVDGFDTILGDSELLNK